MMIVHRNRDCLSGKTFIVSDNKNLVGTWKETESLTAGLCNAFQTYVSHVHGGIHVKRTHPVLQWVDHCARNLTVSVNVKRVEQSDETDTGKRVKVDYEDDSFSVDESEPEDVNIPMVDDQSTEYIGKYKISEVQILIDRGWIIRKGDDFYTTSAYPGKVVENSRVIPSVEVPELLSFIHFNHGHATVAGIRKYLSLWKLWVVNFKAVATAVINTCEHCLICRDTYHPKRSTIPMSKAPMEMVMADFLQPEKDSQPAFLVFRDRFSGYSEGRAIEKLDTPEVKQLLTEWIARFSAPLVFQTDNGKAFRSESMRELYTKFRISHRETPTYDPQANGSVERTIKTIEEGLRVELAAGTPPEYAIHTVCSRINRTVITPGDAEALCPRSLLFKYDDVHPFKIGTSSQTMPFESDLSVGQAVLTRIPNASKLSPQFENRGYMVRSIEGNHVYSLIDGDGQVVPYLYRRDRLKPLPTSPESDDAAMGSGFVRGEGVSPL
jgi:hypothetical protein